MTISSPLLQLDDEYARQVGSVLRDIRESSGGTLDGVAHTLLLSPSQIIGLEGYELKRFYSARIFAQALLKYAKHLNYPIDMDRLTFHRGLLVGVGDAHISISGPKESKSDSEKHWDAGSSVPCETYPALEAPRDQALLATSLGRSSQKSTWIWRKSRTVRLSLCGCVGLIGLSAFVEPDMLEALLLNEGSVRQYFVATTDMPPPQILASQVQDATVLKPEGVVQADKRSDVGANESVPSRADLIVLETTKDCWIQLNYADGKSSQRLHPTGARLEFAPGELAGMIIGDVSAARLVVNQTAITLSNYQKPSTNIARLLGQDAVALLGK